MTTRIDTVEITVTAGDNNDIYTIIFDADKRTVRVRKNVEIVYESKSSDKCWDWLEKQGVDTWAVSEFLEDIS